MSGLTSALKEAIEGLGSKTKIKGQFLEPTLRKKGVKQDEIKWAGLGIDDTKTYSKDELLEKESARKDTFGVVDADIEYSHISIHPENQSHTYFNRVYTFNTAGERSHTEAKQAAVRGASVKVRAMERRFDFEGDEYGESDKHFEDVQMVYRDLEKHFDEATATRIVDEMRHERTSAIDINKRMFEAGGGSRYNAPHMNFIDNYLAHARGFDDTFGTTKTRVLQEIQSDLHQTGRRKGYAGEDQQVSQNVNWAELRDNAGYHQVQLQNAYVVSLEGNPEPLDNLIRDLTEEYHLDSGDIFYEMLDTDTEPTGLVDIFEDRYHEFNGGESAGSPPKSPFEKTWPKKVIEQELQAAVNDGREQLAIPLQGHSVDSNLARGKGEKEGSKGVDDWYKNQVVQDANKIAKDIGADVSIERKISKGESETRMTDAKIEVLRSIIVRSKPTSEESILRQKYKEFYNREVATSTNTMVDTHEVHDIDSLEYAINMTKERGGSSSNLEQALEKAKAIQRLRNERMVKLRDDPSLNERTSGMPSKASFLLADVLSGKKRYETAIDELEQFRATEYVIIRPKVDQAANDRHEKLLELQSNYSEVASQYDAYREKLHFDDGLTPEEIDIDKYANELRADMDKYEKEFMDVIPEEKGGDIELYNARGDEAPKPAQFSFKLYSSPVAGAMAIYTTLKGQNEEQVKAELLQAGNQNPDEIIERAKQIQQAIDSGYSMEEIQQHLEST